MLSLVTVVLYDYVRMTQALASYFSTLLDLAICLHSCANICSLSHIYCCRTSQAMGGQMTFRESLTTRLDILQPKRADVQRFVDQGTLSFTPGVQYVFI